MMNTGIPPSYWLDKPYYSLDAYCKHTLGHKCYKIALNAHMTCPNRDGTLGQRGCIFCSAGGSGDFAVSTVGKSIEEQIEEGLSRFGSKNVGCHYIAYFQAYTNTYAPVPYLEQVFTQALDHPLICGISIATRPDCLPHEVLQLLKSLKDRYPQKFLWIELGLQTIHPASAKLIRRGYDLTCFEEARDRLAQLDIPVIVHVILGLPGETAEDMYQTIQYLNQRKPFGIKLQLLHILDHTDLAVLDAQQAFEALTKEEYLTILTGCLERLDPRIVIHRLTGDGPKDLLLAPRWSLHKRDVLNSLHRTMRSGGLYQGSSYHTEES